MRGDEGGKRRTRRREKMKKVQRVKARKNGNAL